jgi:hypothetical protein
MNDSFSLVREIIASGRWGNFLRWGYGTLSPKITKSFSGGVRRTRTVGDRTGGIRSSFSQTGRREKPW